jgi:2-acylglycerol O-acyltransferase 2
VGGIAELFLSSPSEERLFLKNRKGFIKLALTEGVDVVPIYCFGNTSILTIVKAGLLATMSRKMQVSLTYFWGKFGLPIPETIRYVNCHLREVVLYGKVDTEPFAIFLACAALMGWRSAFGYASDLKPTQDDIDKWHAIYCDEVRRLFDTYKYRVPHYKHKQLMIM